QRPKIRKPDTKDSPPSPAQPKPLLIGPWSIVFGWGRALRAGLRLIFIRALVCVRPSTPGRLGEPAPPDDRNIATPAGKRPPANTARAPLRLTPPGTEATRRPACRG